MDYHSTQIELILKELKTSRDGLSQEDASQRLKNYGPNEIKEGKKESSFAIFLNQFKSTIIFILIAAIIIAVIIGEILDAIVIGIILLLNAALGFVQEYRSEKAIEALKKLTAAKTIAVRSNKEIQVNATEIVPGDIILLAEGDKVPADARIIESANIAVDEAPLTGESLPVEKLSSMISVKTPLPERHNMLYAATTVVRGNAHAVVINTGLQTEVGKIAGMLEKIGSELTPLQKRLDHLGKVLGAIAIVISCVVFLLGLAKGGSVGILLITAIALAVAAIPEGLPAVITIALALGVQRMAKRNALMRRLPVVETLGSTTVICTDKTGTLTQNKMKVSKGFIDLVDHEASAISLKSSIYNAAVLCNNASLTAGDPTEIALLEFASRRVERERLKMECPRTGEIPFSSEKKCMATCHIIKGKKVWYLKGAVEVVLERCVMLERNGRATRMTSSLKKEIETANTRFANESLRVLAFAYGPTTDKLVFVGLLGLRDPPREGVREAVQKCRDAGIKVVMITGDHLLTAKAIGDEIGIKGKAITGQEIETEKWSREVESIGIYARVNPEHKLKIVEALQAKGHIVAMTGDGVNDAPALKKANIGISMSITGTEIAKESSAMVLADDNFSSIVNAVEEGRGIFDNIKKFVMFLLTSNITEVLVILVAAILGLPLPLLAIQILWINLITDGLPALALGVDPASKGIMQRKPRNPKSPFLNRLDIFRILLISVFLTFIIMVMFTNLLPSGLEKAQSVVFTALVILELIVAYLIRIPTDINPLSNKFLVYSIVGSVLLQLIVIYTPIAAFFKVVPLTIMDWSGITIAACGLFLIGIALNYFLPKEMWEADLNSQKNIKMI